MSGEMRILLYIVAAFLGLLLIWFVCDRVAWS